VTWILENFAPVALHLDKDRPFGYQTILALYELWSPLERKLQVTSLVGAVFAQNTV
jgi:hypothetical protein